VPSIGHSIFPLGSTKTPGEADWLSAGEVVAPEVGDDDEDEDELALKSLLAEGVYGLKKLLASGLSEFI
jgi:hypothetical protein